MAFAQGRRIRLKELLEKEAFLVHRFYELTCEHAALIAAEDIEGFAKNLSERQRAIDEITSFHAEAQALFEEYREAVKGGEPEIKELDELTGAMSRELVFAVENDKRSEMGGRKLLEKLSDNAKKAADNRKGVTTYSTANMFSGGSAFFDKKQ